ncbi:MAG: hypothetical protein CTY34_09330, partial [Methylobacter sp.]
MSFKQRLTQIFSLIEFKPTYTLIAIFLFLPGCDADLITLQEAKGKKYLERVENVDFDVPVLYHPITSEKQKEKWIAPSLERTTFDAIRIKALLPDMDYYHEKNAKDFKVRGWGKTVHIMMTHYRVNWPYYFEGAYKRLIKLPESPLL